MHLTVDQGKVPRAEPAQAQTLRSYNDTYVIHYDFSEIGMFAIPKYQN